MAHESRAPFLVLAHHRSGSNFLNDLLQSHPRIECLNEPLSMHTSFFRECDLVPWGEHDFDPELLHRSLATHAELRAYLGELKQHLLQSNSGRVIGFKETSLFGKLEWLKAFIPSLKIILLKRDPRAIVSSVLRSGLAPLWNYEALVPPVFREICPRYRSEVESGDSATHAAQTVAMSIAVRYELARRTLHLFENRTLDLADFASHPAKCLHLLCEFLGVEPDPAQMAFLTRRQGVSRGGTFSSFRSREDVELAWRSHLGSDQIRVIENVMRAAGQGVKQHES